MYDLNMIGRGAKKKVSLEISAECIEPYAIIYAAIGDGDNVIRVR